MRMLSRLLALVLLIAWTACYARCSAELVGAKEAFACCTHQMTTQQHQPLDEHTNCGICKVIASGSLSTTSSSLLVTAALVLLAFAGVTAFLWLSVFQVHARRSGSITRGFRHPNRTKPRLSEFLASTAYPVRGPAFLMA